MAGIGIGPHVGTAIAIAVAFYVILKKKKK